MGIAKAEEDYVGYECRFATYIEPSGSSKDDYHLVKLRAHLKDGTTKPILKVIKNYKRDYHITKPAFRKHKDKKEWEKIERLQRYECVQSQLVFSIAKSLGNPGFKGSLRKLCNSPYVYGADITSTALIKQQYMDKYPTLNTKHSVSVFDIETDVVFGTGDIIMATVSFGNKVVTSISKDFLGKLLPQARELLFIGLHKYLGEYVAKRGIEWEICFADSPANIVLDCFKRIHEWMPDFVAIWNIDFDLPRVVAALQKENVSPADVFSDPSVPHNLRFFKYVKGPTQKVTASGKITPIKPSAQWHSATCPASFAFIDAMCAYRQIRVGSAEEPSYSLNSILMKHLGIRKLKFTETDHLGDGLPWHIEMQTNYKIEYVIYNVFDCIGVEELDEKTLDLCLSLHGMAGCSDYARFNSQPRRLVDDIHHYVLKNKGMVIGTTSDSMEVEFDKQTIGLDGWIVMLSATNVADNGMKIILENGEIRTNARPHTGDLDVSASYPNGEVVFNISKGTTKKELISIDNISEHQRRMQGINFSGGPSNAAEFTQQILKAPMFEDMLRVYISQVNAEQSDDQFNLSAETLLGEGLERDRIRQELREALGYNY